jgi:DNA-directed RNA polymerase specialized sigma24 family protein
LGSVTKLIDQIKGGDDVASHRLWDLFAPRLLGLARVKISSKSMPLGDEEDVVLSALTSFFEGIEKDEYAGLSDRETIWRLLSLITKRKAFNLVMQDGRQKRLLTGNAKASLPRRRPDPRLIHGNLNTPVDPQLPPDIQILLEEQCQRLLDVLGSSQLRSLVLLKMEGLTDEAVADKLGCSVRTIERKIRLIRSIWSRTP